MDSIVLSRKKSWFSKNYNYYTLCQNAQGLLVFPLAMQYKMAKSKNIEKPPSIQFPTRPAHDAIDQ